MGLNRLYGGVALCAMVAGTAAAQEQRPTLLGEILVLGEKSERNLQETRTGVQVFTQEIIEDSSIEDIDDVLDQTANATQRFGGEGFAIRGIQNANVAGGGQSPLATFYVDGAPFNSFALRTGIEEVWDVAQVEIFKGPQSTLFGRNALAGVINLKTNDPEYANYARFRAQGGTQETYGGSFVINGNIIDGELALRIAGDWNSSDGFYDNPTLRNDRQAFNRNQSLRGKLLFEPFDNVSNVLTLTYSNNESGDD
ncbi:MAG: TonB-dependent receptor plug domain-containing protein, partial [Pseudomonadota bacterium]